MFKNDRFMTVITALILAIFAGTMVRYSDRIMAMMSGEAQVESHDDFYSVRANARQVLDVLANDDVKGPIILLSEPSCGVVSLADADTLQYASTQECSGEVTFAYCVDTPEGCNSNSVTVNVVAIETTPKDTPDDTESQTPVASGEQEPEIGVEAPQMAAIDPSDAASAQIGQIEVSMQAPTLAAPSVDEVISPDVALSGIRNQTVLMSDTPENLDQSIGQQSSTEVASNAGLDINSIAAPVINSEQTAGVSLGAEAPLNPVTPQAPVSLTATDAEQPLTQAEHGPVALATLQGSDLSGFGPATPNLLDPAPLALSPETPQPPAANTDSQLLAELDQAEQSPTVAANGPTALIALQIKAPSNGNVGEDLNLVLAEPNAPVLASMQAVPRLATQVAPGPEGLTLLEREPTSLSQAPGFRTAYTDGLLEQANTGAQVALSNRPETPPANSHSGKMTVTPFATRTPIYTLSTTPALQRNSTVLVRLSTTGLPEIGTLATGGGLTPAAPDPHNYAGNALALAAPTGGGNALPDVFADPAPNPVQEGAVQLANLDDGAVTPDNGGVAVDQASICEVSLDPAIRDNAMILLFITAECKPQMPVTISHAGMEFSVLMGDDGTASISFPALERVAEIDVTFADGTQASTQAIVPRIDQMTRIAVSWRGDADLDLHAFEYGAAEDDEGHVWSGAPRSPQVARNTGGYLLELGEPGIVDGAHAEVYTMPIRRDQRRGIVAMSLEIADGTPVCSGGIAATTIAMRNNDSAVARHIRFNTPTCGMNQLHIAIPRAVNDIRLAGR